MRKVHVCTVSELHFKGGGVRGQRSLMISTINYVHQLKRKVSLAVVEFSLPHSVFILFRNFDYIPCLYGSNRVGVCVCVCVRVRVCVCVLTLKERAV